MIDASAESTRRAAETMANDGGSFVKELGSLWYCADPINQQKLCDAFGHYFVKHGARDDSTFAMPPLIGWVRFGKRQNEIQVMIQAKDERNVHQYSAITINLDDLTHVGKWLEFCSGLRRMVIDGLKLIGEYGDKKSEGISPKQS